MTWYKFECDEGHETYVRGSMADPPQAEDQSCETCGGNVFRIFSSRVFTFTPYVADHFGPIAREVRTVSERESLCDEHDITYDSGRYVRPPKHVPASKSVTLGDVKQAIDRGEGGRTASEKADGLAIPDPVPGDGGFSSRGS